MNLKFKTHKDPRYFNNVIKSESNSEKSQNSEPFNLNFPNVNPHQSNNFFDNINSNNFNDNLYTANNKQNEETNMTENNNMMEQNYYLNQNKKTNLYNGLKENAIEDYEKKKFFEENHIINNKIHEVSEKYEEFEKEIKTDNCRNQLFNYYFNINFTEEEILLIGLDIDDSFIAEQFYVEKLINDESKKKPNLFQKNKEEKDLNIINSLCYENKKEKTKKLSEKNKTIKEEMSLENFNNKDFENIKKMNSEKKEKPDESDEKMKSKEISKEEKEEFNKNQKLETSNSGRKDQEDSITNKNIFYIDKKNKPLFKVGPPNISNSTTKDSIISNSASNTCFKCQDSIFSDISNAENRDKILNITKISKDESKLNESNIILNNFEMKQNIRNSFMFFPNINKNENPLNNLSANNIANFQSKKDEFEEELKNNDTFLNLKRDRVKEKIKDNMRTLGDFEKNIYREFSDYLIEKENENDIKDNASLDKNFWNLIHTKNISKSNLEFEGNKIKSYSYNLIKYIFSKDDISNIYEDFLKDINFHQKYISKNKKRYKYKNNNSYELYRKNIHKIYCEKFKENELELT